MSCEKLNYVISVGESYLSPERRPVGMLMMAKAAYVQYHPFGVIGMASRILIFRSYHSLELPHSQRAQPHWNSFDSRKRMCYQSLRVGFLVCGLHGNNDSKIT
jgi:hypothetical protein